MGFSNKLGLTASMNVTLKTRNTYVRMDVDEFYIAFAGTSANVHSHWRSCKQELRDDSCHDLHYSGVSGKE